MVLPGDTCRSGGGSPIPATRYLRGPLRWLHPGLGVKRWLLLLLVGLALVGFGAVLLLNLFAYELTALVGGPERAVLAGSLALVAGVAVVGIALVAVVRNIARALLPDEKQLVDRMLVQRRLGSGLRVVAIGGGTGLSSLLRGLKRHSTNLTAVVVVSDDGGSSGRLSKEMPGLSLPPGDIRACIAALADEEPLMTQLLQYRFDESAPDLSGHSLGNLLIAALEEITGDFQEAIRETARVLAIRGSVMPPTLQRVKLCARLRSGEMVVGETSISNAPAPIDYVYFDPATPEPLPDALEAIANAELIVMGPGSLYTSVIPNLLVPGLARAVAASPAVRVYVCNVMTQPGETTGMSAADHVRAVLRHTEEPILEYVVLNSRRPAALVRDRYAATGAQFIAPDARQIAKMGLIPVEAPLLAGDDYARHDSAELAKLLVQLASR
jgi:uncharacterized cofD-like protein